MAGNAIEIRQLRKSYQIRQAQVRQTYRTLREDLVQWVRHPLSRRQGGTKKEFFWALDDISVEIRQGDTVGIIGRNGAGKSTLLKVLSRITSPTSGEVTLYGRVGSLLEVGTGFHPELTGRENIFLNGSIMGMRRREVIGCLDEIVDFAGIEQFLDTPVKRYSSGMYVRLAFAVAAHLSAEILLIDEVLAVGDAGFQKKVLGKVEGISRQGRTVLFVSHQMGHIAALCQRCLLIEGGRLTKDGPPQAVIDAYLATLQEVQETSLRDRRDRQGTGRIRAVDVWLEDAGGNRAEHFFSGDQLTIALEYELAGGERLDNVLVSFGIQNSYGLWVTDLASHLVKGNLSLGPHPGRVACTIPRLPLNSGIFTFNTMLRAGDSGYEIYDAVQNAGTFSVEPGDFYRSGTVPSGPILLNIDHHWHVAERSGK